MNKTFLAAAALMLVASTAHAQQQRDPNSMGGGNCADNVYNCATTPNPLPAPNTVWIEEMTWMDVRDALADGKTTVIIPTGGVEPNGPWLATGKHNFVLRANCDAIARELGNALCAPIIKLVPEGDIEPPSSHMTSPGTISMRQETFEAMLTDVAHSLKMHGFRNIIFIGDSGGNQSGQRAVAERLNAKWDGTVVAHVQEYYDYATVTRYMEFRGLRQGEGDGLHDDPVIALNMFADDPSSIRYAERAATGNATINGVSLADRVQNVEWAREIVSFRATETARHVRRAIGQGGTTPTPQRAGGGGGRGGQGFQRPAPDPRSMGGGECSASPFNCVDTPNPLPAANTVWIEDMTWMDVRDALGMGKTTAIIATGGMEPNGPWLVTGKHNYVLRANCDRIARKLGDALCAPILELVPEGGIEPPTGHMTSPGTISLREETFAAVLTDMAESLRQHGFDNIVFIGDSGGNQRGMESVATALNAKWGGAAKAHFIAEYYRAPAGSRDVLRELGVTRDGMASDGLHDDIGITLNMMLDDPNSVRWAERVVTGQAVINGVDISDLTQSLVWAEEVANERSERTAKLIRERIGME
ncbi:MAG: creatininase family protein [Gemmatimonadetes bacterium]|nr:creatininase family protein [Gemmatimonadota bacterium]MDA1103651.1 creatininase family protein [Gemmatimonadota bacterium]